MPRDPPIGELLIPHAYQCVFTHEVIDKAPRRSARSLARTGFNFDRLRGGTRGGGEEGGGG